MSTNLFGLIDKKRSITGLGLGNLASNLSCPTSNCVRMGNLLNLSEPTSLFNNKSVIKCLLQAKQLLDPRDLTLNIMKTVRAFTDFKPDKVRGLG